MFKSKSSYSKSELRDGTKTFPEPNFFSVFAESKIRIHCPFKYSVPFKSIANAQLFLFLSFL